MDGKEPYKLIHPFVHSAVEFGKGDEVGTDLDLLLGGLLEQTLGHDKLYVSPSNEDLLEAVFHAADAIRDEGKTGAVEDGFLHPGQEPETQVLAHLPDFPEEIQVQYQFLVPAAAQVIQ